MVSQCNVIERRIGVDLFVVLYSNHVPLGKARKRPQFTFQSEV